MYQVMIVDDEPVISRGLAHFINWSSLDCEIVGQAENGLEAIEMIKNRTVNIIISDIKMPGLDGLELAKYVYENSSEIKMIILTGYADFSYAQTAIEYGVIDFVLKPAFTEKIIASVNKAKKILKEENERKAKMTELENEADSNIFKIQKEFIRDVISEVIVDENFIQEYMKSLRIRIDRYCILVFQIEKVTEEEHLPFDKTIYSVGNFIALAFKEYRQYTVYMDKKLLCSVLAFDTSEETECVQKIIKQCEEILEIANNYLKFTISIGISSRYEGAVSLPVAYQEACSALTNKFYDEGNIFIFSSRKEKDSPTETYEINSCINKIMLHIQAGQCEEAIKIMRVIIEKEKKTKQMVNHITGLGINICSCCSKLLSNLNLNLESVIDGGDTLYKKIIQCDTISKLEQILTLVIRNTGEALNSSQRMNNYIVTAAKKYITAHYHENIKLNKIASHVHVNSSYLSRTFKKETGETITEAINNLRVEKAKELLSNLNIKTYEVANLVGIDDPTYFSQVFKKYTGVSPTEYRYFNGT